METEQIRDPETPPLIQNFLEMNVLQTVVVPSYVSNGV